MNAPVWMNSVIADFGRAAGLESLSLNEVGTAALNFETGVALRLEYTGQELVVAVTVPHADLKHLLAISHPEAKFGFRVRTGILAKSSRAVIAVRLEEREVTLPRLNAVFTVLWRLAEETGGSQWA